MARAVIRVTWKNDGAVQGQGHSASVNINETRRILTGTSSRNHPETGPFHLAGTSFYVTPFDQNEPDVATLVDTFQEMLLHFVNRSPNSNPRAQVQTVALTLWNIVEGAGPDEAEGVPQVEVDPQDLSDVVDPGGSTE